MSRKRALDYDKKLDNIASVAAKLFATSGYSGARMSEIAAACDVSKSMLYHYFPTKDDLLFYMIREHLLQVVSDLEAAVIPSDDRSSDSINKVVSVFMKGSSLSRQRNLVAMNEVKYLSAPKHEEIRKLERRVVELVANQLSRLKPDLPKDLLKPYAFFLIGMVNYSDSWCDPDGTIPFEEISSRISNLFLDGFSRL